MHEYTPLLFDEKLGASIFICTSFMFNTKRFVIFIYMQVARRYGKSSSSSSSSSQQTLLEKKRQKRAAARLAAEARQRREYPRSSPLKDGGAGATASNNYSWNSPSFRGGGDGMQHCDNGTSSVHHREGDSVQSASRFHSDMSYNTDASDIIGRENEDTHERRESSSTQQQFIGDDQNGYSGSINENDNMEYYSQNMESYYNDDQQQNITQPTTTTAQEMDSNPSPTRIPPKSPRSQPTTTTRIETSHVEDVLALSLELERTRSELKAANEQLSTIQSQNVLEELRMEKIKSKEAEEDAALALELAKDAQAVKEECEEWLTRSLDEIEFWKNKCLMMEKEIGHRGQGGEEEDDAEEDNENKKLVRFKEDCPPSPMVSVEGDASIENEKRLLLPPPPPPGQNVQPSPDNATFFTPQSHASGTKRGITFTPNSDRIASKAAVASGRLYLHNASPELSPHPRIRASELMKRSAETRRILRERLAAGRLDGSGPMPPPSMAHIAAVAAKSKKDGASTCVDNDTSQQQKVVLKTVGDIIYESGHRLKLVSKQWNPKHDASGLESIVKEYCGQVEEKIGQQEEKIDELTAFCDHLEVDIINSR
jgi:hypothetical protein